MPGKSVILFSKCITAAYSPTRVRRIVFRGIVDAGCDETQQDNVPVRRWYDEVDKTVRRRCEVAAFNYYTKPLVFTAHSHAELYFLVRCRDIVVPRDT